MTFDQAARTYDQDFTQGSLARWLRGRVWERLEQLFAPGMRVLELGCGTGEDALYLAKRGVQVVATDASPAMLAQTQAKAQRENITLTTQRFDFNDAATWEMDGHFDGAYSNFGALNCTSQWRQLGAWLADHLKPGAKVGLGVMGRFCLWETLWHGLHGDWRTAKRRWSGQGTASLADGSQLPVFYPSPRELMAHLEDNFHLQHWQGVGVFLPSSDIYPVVEARPRFQNWLTHLEYHLAHRRPWRAWGDHYWLELQTKGAV